MSVQRAMPRLLAGFLATAAACSMPVEHGLAVPIPLTFSDGLLSAYGEALLSRDQRCGVDPGDAPPERPASPTVLLELANPLSVVSVPGSIVPQPFRHGQVRLNASQGGIQGSPRFLLCDVPLLRGNQAFSEYRLDHTLGSGPTVSTGPLGAVLGSDLFARFALTFAFSGAGASMSARLTLQHSDLKDSCFIDDAVLPFQPVGGDLKVRVGDSIVTYTPTLVTVAACVEPVADPFAYRPSGATVQSCIDESKFSESQCVVEFNKGLVEDRKSVV